ncbi:hypothetical protein [Pseudoxanthomonas mexicana]
MKFASAASWLLIANALFHTITGASVEAAIYLSASLILRAMMSLRGTP